MINRKTRRANLEKTIPFFFRIGLITSISLAIVAFEWRTPISEYDCKFPGDWEPMVETEIIPITFQPEKKLELPKEDQNSIALKSEPVEPVIKNKPDSKKQPEISKDIVDEMYIPEPLILDPVIIAPEIVPRFPGGSGALENYLQNNVKYPAPAKDINLTGIVYFSFTVSSNGEIKDIEILNDIGGGCGNEAIRVLKNMPKWIPGKQGGLAVNVKMSMGLNFGLID